MRRLRTHGVHNGTGSSSCSLETLLFSLDVTEPLPSPKPWGQQWRKGDLTKLLTLSSIFHLDMRKRTEGHRRRAHSFDEQSRRALKGSHNETSHFPWSLETEPFQNFFQSSESKNIPYDTEQQKTLVLRDCLQKRQQTPLFFPYYASETHFILTDWLLYGSFFHLFSGQRWETACGCYYCIQQHVKKEEWKRVNLTRLLYLLPVLEFGHDSDMLKAREKKKKVYTKIYYIGFTGKLHFKASFTFDHEGAKCDH